MPSNEQSASGISAAQGAAAAADGKLDAVVDGTADYATRYVVVRPSDPKKFNGTVLVEPGVGFYDLFDYVEQNNIPYWISPIGNSWGSVIGNALDRGVGYTSYPDNVVQAFVQEAAAAGIDLFRFAALTEHLRSLLGAQVDMVVEPARRTEADFTHGWILPEWRRPARRSVHPVH